MWLACAVADYGSEYALLERRIDISLQYDYKRRPSHGLLAQLPGSLKAYQCLGTAAPVSHLCAGSREPGGALHGQFRCHSAEVRNAHVPKLHSTIQAQFLVFGPTNHHRHGEEQGSA